MNLEYVPLIPVMQELYRLPRNMARFRTYLRTIFPNDESRDQLLPLLAMNPMAKDHVMHLLDALLTIDADGIGARATAEAAAELADIPGDFKVGIVIADDWLGGWTNRYADEFTFRFCYDHVRAHPNSTKRPRWLKDCWITGVLWSSEPANEDAARQAVKTAVYRTAYLAGAEFQEAKLAGANLSNSNLSNATFAGADLTDANLNHAVLTGAFFSYGPDVPASLSKVGLKSAQLSGAIFDFITLNDVDLSGANLSGASFNRTVFNVVKLRNANLTNAFSDFSRVDHFNSADVTGADARGATESHTQGYGTLFRYGRNMIYSDGSLYNLLLNDRDELIVRNYHGDPSRTPEPLAPIPIQIQARMIINQGGTLQIVFDADKWDSVITFQPAIPVILNGGTLDLTFAEGTDLSEQLGKTIDLFDWSGVSPTGAFTITSKYKWDLSRLYSTGEVTLLNFLMAGDFSTDGQVNAADIPAMLLALADLNSYKAANHLSGDDLLSIGDLDGDRNVTNRDLQSLLNLLAGIGSGSVTTVSEPSSLLIVIVGTVLSWLSRLRVSCRSRHRSAAANRLCC